MSNLPGKLDLVGKWAHFLSTCNIHVIFHHTGDMLLSSIHSAVHWIIQSTLRSPPPLVSNHLSSVTSFPKHQKFPIPITVFGTFCSRIKMNTNLFMWPGYEWSTCTSSFSLEYKQCYVTTCMEHHENNIDELFWLYTDIRFLSIL